MNLTNIFKGKTANDVWLQIYDQLSSLTVEPQESRIGPTQEILHALISIENPRARWICSRVPTFNPAFSIAEVVWIMNGRNDSKFLNFWNSKLPEYAGKGPTYHGAYGHRLRKNFTFDQLEKAYLALKNNPKSRQVVLQIWDPNRDFPDKDGEAVSADIPCNLLSMLKVRDGKLEWQQIMRSNDIILGLPYNIIQFTTLQEVIAGWIGIDLGSYNHLSDSLHIYVESKSEYSSLKSVTVNENSDDLRLPKEQSEKIFEEFANKIDKIVQGNYTQDSLSQIANWEEASTGYQNLLCVVCAEAARKANYNDLSQKFMTKCTNPLLKQAWNLWKYRFSTSGNNSPNFLNS